MIDHITPVDELQEEEQSPEDENIERDYLWFDEDKHPNETIRDDEHPPSQYNWDDDDDHTGSLFRANTLSTPDMGCCERKGHMVTHDKQAKTMSCGSDHHSSKPICLQAGVTTGNKPSLYDHCMRKCTGTRPTRSRKWNQTLSGFWEINGTQAHCLLDSGCEGVMISPDYAWAMGIKTFKLE